MVYYVDDTTIFCPVERKFLKNWWLIIALLFEHNMFEQPSLPLLFIKSLSGSYQDKGKVGERDLLGKWRGLLHIAGGS